MIESTRLAFQPRQIVDGIEERLFPVPAPHVTRHAPVFADQPHLVDRRHDRDRPAGIGGRDRITIGVEPDQRQRIGRRLSQTPGLERLLRRPTQEPPLLGQQVLLAGRLSVAGEPTPSRALRNSHVDSLPNSQWWTCSATASKRESSIVCR